MNVCTYKPYIKKTKMKNICNLPPRWACGSKKIMISRVGSSKMGLWQKRNHDFSDWVIQAGPAAATKLSFFGLGHPRWACGIKKIMIFRIGSSKVGLRRQKINIFDF